MTSERAKEILLLYSATRPQDDELKEALTVAERDPELKEWFHKHKEFQEQVRSRLLQVSPPEHLKQALLARRKTVVLIPWWKRQTSWVAAAAAVMLFAGLYMFSLSPGTPANRFSEFQSRMVSIVLREYRMDVETNDMAAVRQYMASRNAPADYELTPGLRNLEVAGGGFIRWRNNPISMICFRRPDREMVYLFVMDENYLEDPPSPNPAVRPVHDMQTAAWSSGGKAYLLAAPRDDDLRRNYL